MLALRRIRRPTGPRVKKRTPTRPGGRVTGPSRPGRVRPTNPGRVGGKRTPAKPKRVIDKSPAARQAFLQSLTKEELSQRFHRDPRRTPARVQQSSKQKSTMERVSRGRVEAPSQTKRVQPSRVERVAKGRASTAQPSVRKRRKKGPSYTVTSLNV